jgi:hypothetical protein
VLLHWNGRSWTRAAGPVPGSLSAASAPSAGNAWAVGQFDTSTALETLVLHWNGRSWTRVPSPSPGPAPVGDNLAGVSALSQADAWAVGDEDTFGPPDPVFKTLVLHWNGTKWALVASPNPSPQFDSLTSVSAVSPGDAWAVGVAGKGSDNIQALVLHWNGRAWIPVPTPSPPGSRLTGVSALSPRDAWAVGETITPAGVHKTLVLHWNGTAWALVSSPSPSPSDSGLAGVSALSPRDVWAAGVTLDSRAHRHTLILHWNGTDWTRVPNDQTLILHWNGTRWTRS